MELIISDDHGLGLDATVEVEPGIIILHSRGGAIGSSNARNRDYSVGLRLILKRILTSHIQIVGAWVDSSRVQILPLTERAILHPSDLPENPDNLFTLVSRRMQAVGRSPHTGRRYGNSNRRIKISVEVQSIAEIVKVIGAIEKTDTFKMTTRLPTEQLRKITPEHIWQAITETEEFDPSGVFGPSTDYDLLSETGSRLPPKAVFGRAASLALGISVGPQQFSAGKGTPCFKILEEAGYRIVRKSDPVVLTELLSEEDRVWAEGKPRLVSHLRRERGHGLAKAKKAEFLRLHGRLFCEKCEMDPIEVFGSEDGEACIEVHHHSTAVSEMRDGHKTRLEDLQCLCANCHRYIHRVMKKNGLSE
ncbi:hypothetical protein PVT71_13705 [Salipiger sp. H15]|uniref:ScoMcrA-like N-terminal head domain-containing protein n=1 Tax=Alloyangia sp. H15 TaxID=3029062 RepID=A0AAU8AGE7_9RHOB